MYSVLYDDYKFVCSGEGRQRKLNWCIWRMPRSLRCMDFIYNKQRC